MLPTKQQYKNWTLPSKYGFWGLVLTVLLSFPPIIVSIVDWVRSVPTYAVIAFNFGQSEMTIYGDSGDSPERAVIIRGSNSHEAGIKAEYHWISRRYPGYKPVGRRTVSNPEPPSMGYQRATFKDRETGLSVEIKPPPSLPPRLYDAFEIRNWYGRSRIIYFDINHFIGKLSEPRPPGAQPYEEPEVTLEKFRREVDNELKLRESLNSQPKQKPATQPNSAFKAESEHSATTPRAAAGRP